jgi:hypothetical protein
MGGLVMLLGLFLAGTLPSAAQLGEFKRKAEEAMQAGNYAEAFCIIKPLALQGNADAQFSLGWMYANGYGLRINEREAFRWWHEAAEQGHPEAMFTVAMAYLNGEGVEKDERAALEWLHKAALRGVDDAEQIIRSRAAQGRAEAVALVRALLRTDWAPFAARLWIQVDRANVRRRPSTSAELVTTLPQGHELIELTRQGDWIQVGVTKTGEVGWISRKLVGEDPPS